MTEAIPARRRATTTRTSGTNPPRNAARLAWSLWAISSALVASSLLLDLLTPNFFVPPERPALVLVLVADLLSLAAPAVGVLIVSRLPRSPVGWIFCGIGLLYGLRRLAAAYADHALLARSWLPLGEHAAWISTWLRFSGLFALAALAVLFFPTGLPSRRWRVVAWAAAGGAVLIALGDALRFGPLPAYYYAHNPFGIPGNAFPETSSVAGGALLAASVLAAAVSLVLRLRRSREEERRRLGWFAYAAFPALAFSAAILLDWTVERFALLFLGQKTVWPALRVAESSGVFAREAGAPGRLVELRLDMLLESLAILALLMIPVCTAVAVLRHRLYDTDPAVDDALRGVVAGVSALRWRRVLPAGVVVGFLPFAFIYLAIYAFVIFYPVFGQGDVDRELLAGVGDFVTGWGVRAFYLAATLLAASWVARGAGEKAALHGVLVGLVSVVVNQAITSLFDRLVLLDELPVYLALGVAGGYLGGIAGRTSISGGVYRASRQIGRAKSASDIAAAIGEHLGGPGTRGVSVWRAASADDGSEQGFLLWGSWGPRGEEPWSPHARLDATRMPALARLPERTSVLARAGDLPAAGRVAWERSGVRSVLLIPLISPSGAWNGLLLAAFRNRRRLSRGLVRAYLTVAAQAALALENLRLIEEARTAGRRAGVLVERQRLAREIHDTLAQGFTSIITNLTAAQIGQRASAPERHLEEARRTARESLAEARRLVWALRPEALDRHSLPEALERLATEWSRETGIEARAGTTGAPRQLLPESEVALLRAAQEALANVRKHARAARVNITLSYVGDRVLLDVLDDGVGFDPAGLEKSVDAHDEGGFGLAAMRERIEQLGGVARVESEPGEGTTVAVELPIAPRASRQGT